MPTVLDTAKEASYTALGLNVLLFDEMRDRLTAPRQQVSHQLEIARTHAKKARAEWPTQVQPAALRTFEAAAPTISRLADLVPAPIEGVVKDGISRVRDLLVDEPEVTKPTPKKSAAPKSKAKTGTTATKKAKTGTKATKKA